MKSLVNEATKDDRNPVSGFLLTQIAQKTQQSVEDCRILEEVIMKKLEKNKPNIKLKCLKIVKYVAENGHQNWKLGWQRHSEKLRQCSHYRGPPHPIYGDTPYEQVRRAAKESMEAVFSSIRKDSSRIQDRIKGMSNSRSNTNQQGLYGGAMKVTNVGKSMPGMGNTTYLPSGDYKPKYNPHASAPPRTNGFQTRAKLDNRTNRAGKRKKGQVGGGWVEDKEDLDEYSQEDEEDRDQSFDSENETSENENTQKVKSSGEFEYQLVDKLTQPTGVRARPTDEILTKFAQQFLTCDQLLICEYLDEKLDSSEWQQQLKALCGVEAILRCDSEKPAKYFRENFEVLEELSNSTRKTVRQKAKEIMRTIKPKQSVEKKSRSKREQKEDEPPLISFENDKPKKEKEPDLIGSLLEMDPKQEKSKTSDGPALFGGLNLDAPSNQITKKKTEEPQKQVFDPLSFLSSNTTQPVNPQKVQQSQPSQPATIFPFQQHNQSQTQYSNVRGLNTGLAPQVVGTSAFQFVNQQTQNSTGFGYQQAPTSHYPPQAFPMASSTSFQSGNQFPQQSNDPFSSLMNTSKISPIPPKPKSQKDAFADLKMF